MVHARGAFRRVGIPAEGIVQRFAVQSILDKVQIVAEIKVIFLHTLAELRAVRFKIIKPNAELFIVNAKMCFPLVYGSVRQYRAKAQPRTVVHRKQLQNFIRDCVVHETGSHIFLPFFRNFRERHLKISAGGNILFGNGANHGKAFFCFNSSYPTVRRILHGRCGGTCLRAEFFRRDSRAL